MKSIWVRAAGGAALVFVSVLAIVLLRRVVGGAPVIDELLLPVLMFLALVVIAISLLCGRLYDARRRAARATAAAADSQERLAASQRRFAVAFDASPLPSAIIRTADQRIVAVNEAAVRWLGEPRERLLALRVGDLAVDGGDLARAMADLDAKGSVVRATIAIDRGGERRTLSVFGDRIMLEGASHTLVILEDVTDREAIERARRESETRFAAAFEACPLPFVMMRMDDRTLVAVNDAFATFHGYTRGELLGHRTEDFDFYADPFERDLARAALARDGRIHDYKLAMRLRDGSIRKVEASIETVAIDGIPYGVAVFADITEEEEAERELRMTQELFSKVFTASPLARSIVRADDMAYVEVNDAYVALFGYTREELAGKRVVDFSFFVDSPAEVAERAVRMAREPVHAMPMRFRTKSGAIISTLFYSEMLTIDGVTLLTATIQDVTDRTRAEAALRESEERFVKAFEGGPLPSAIARVSDRVIVALNDGWLSAFGYTRDELSGKTSADIAMYADAADGMRVRELVARDGAVRDIDLRFRRKDGSLFDASWSVQTIEIGGEPHYLGTLQDITERKRAEAAMRESEARFRQLAENIREVFWLYDAAEKNVIYVSPAYETVWGRSAEALAANPDDWVDSIDPEDRARVLETRRRHDYDQHYRIVRGDGTMRWIHDRAFPVRDESGKVVRIAGLAEDVTERRALEEQLLQTQKMESLGMLAGGVAHDFNNILAVISSSSCMLAEALPQTGEERELVEEIDAAVQRATGLTRQLLAFSRKQVVEPKVIDINCAVEETRKMLRRMVGEDVLLQTSLEPELGHVKVDPGYLVQVLMNLAVNARDAMPRGGTLEITTRHWTINEAQARLHAGIRPGPAVKLSVIDTGCGIAPEVLAHIFEPFFTTKEQGKGTGMGLAVVHGIVDQAGGIIEVTSEVGTGTTFSVYFPIVNAEVARHEEVAGALALGAERILLVDDDEYVRRSAARALRARGYTVLEAADGQAALLQLHNSVDLLLTDVVMPRMDGRQLAELARARKPDLKVVYTSGYTDDAIVRHGVADGNFELIEKPFRMNTLAMRLRQVLDR